MILSKVEILKLISLLPASLFLADKAILFVFRNYPLPKESRYDNIQLSPLKMDALTWTACKGAQHHNFCFVA